jgi:opacity protein-like surface antigen
MKKIVFLMVLFTAVVFTAAAADPVIITVINNTGEDIYYLYVSRSDSDDWGDDLLDDDVLEPGEGYQVSLPPGTWDIQVEDDWGDTYTKSDVRIIRSTVIKMTPDDLDDD